MRYLILCTLLLLATGCAAPHAQAAPPATSTPTPTRAPTSTPTIAPTRTTTPAPTPPAHCTVTAWRLFIRAEPRRASAALGVLTRGERLAVLDQSGAWLQIGTGAWISAYYCKLEETQ